MTLKKAIEHTETACALIKRPSGHSVALSLREDQALTSTEQHAMQHLRLACLDHQYLAEIYLLLE